MSQIQEDDRTSPSLLKTLVSVLTEQSTPAMTEDQSPYKYIPETCCANPSLVTHPPVLWVRLFARDSSQPRRRITKEDRTFCMYSCSRTVAQCLIEPGQTLVSSFNIFCPCDPKPCARMVVFRSQYSINDIWAPELNPFRLFILRIGLAHRTTIEQEKRSDR